MKVRIVVMVLKVLMVYGRLVKAAVFVMLK